MTAMVSAVIIGPLMFSMPASQIAVMLAASIAGAALMPSRRPALESEPETVAAPIVVPVAAPEPEPEPEAKSDFTEPEPELEAVHDAVFEQPLPASEERDVDALNRDAAERAQRLSAELRAAADEAQRLKAEAEQREREMEQRLAEERARLTRELEATLEKRLEEKRAREQPPANTLLSTIAGWFDRKPPVPKVSISRRRRTTPARQPANVVGRLLLFEKRRGTAETAIPKLRQLGIAAEVVERVVDAADEIHRFRPDALLIDSELPDFEKSCALLTKENPKLPLFVTGRSIQEFVPPPSLQYVSFVVRPYDVEELVRIAREAQSGYHVKCASCGVVFDAMDGDWCSCITHDRSIVCTNCLTCFCKAPQSYKEQFWAAAPLALHERRITDVQRIVLPPNPIPAAAKRPLVLSIESDPAIQQTIQRVCINLGYGFIYAVNAADAITLARVYRPELILTGAIPAPQSDAKVVVVGEAPVALTELINLLQRHLEGAAAI
jgi:DNA-binding response OmpR family regulator